MSSSLPLAQCYLQWRGRQIESKQCLQSLVVSLQMLRHTLIETTQGGDKLMVNELFNHAKSCSEPGMFV